ncbi:hypothetical protein OROMI_031556 [Orobanche minor]
MKYTFLFFSILCLAAYTECYGGGRGSTHNPLRELLKTRKSREPTNLLTEDFSDSEYSPVYVASQKGRKEADKIVKLPGQPTVDFEQYSGYVTVDPRAGRALFYYFSEAVHYSSSKPLVLWLNGGMDWPGCSSIGAGAMTELGPFRVNPDGKTLWYNKYAWNNVANVLFLESPAGVGFSYSNRSSDYVTGDNHTARDSYTFLLNWLERFPEYKTRDFFITGESYAGIAIGNAYIDYTDRWGGTFDHLWTSALISDETHEGIIAHCDFSSETSYTQVCGDYADKAYTEMGQIDIYNIYAPLCGNKSSSGNAPSISTFDPCSSKYVSAYLNTPQVQESMHANITGVPGPWQECNDPISSNWTDNPETVLPVIKKLMASGISVWIYSGDIDGIIPVTTTRYSMTKLKARVKTSWYPWYLKGKK